MGFCKIMRSLPLILGVVLSALLVYAAGLENETLAGLSLGASGKTVIQKHGQPSKKTKPVYQECCDNYWQVYLYPNLGLEVGLESARPGVAGSITMIKIAKKAKFTTSKGIKIGALKLDVRNACGNPDEDSSDEVDWYYRDEDHWRILSFKFQGDAVIEISFSTMGE